MTFRYLYSEKTPDNTVDFIKRMIDYFTFRVHCIQTNNGTEFTALQLHLGFAAGTHIDGVVESTHNRDQKEFYDYCVQELTLDKANQKLRRYNNFWNHKRIHLI